MADPPVVAEDIRGVGDDVGGGEESGRAVQVERGLSGLNDKRDDGEYCIITTRVRGLRFDTISKR